MRHLFCILFIFFFHFTLHPQDSASKNPKWFFNGYIKELQSFGFDKNFRSLNFTNLIHNRLNLKWKPCERITAAVEVRNRFYWGDDVRFIPGFKRQLRNSNEWQNLSVNWMSTKNATVHSNIERLWMEYRKTKWNLRAGRQRINWGVANIWNPNDIFNSYNFLDFDYEERPGSDAAKYQYTISDLTNIEVSVAAMVGNTIAAAKYFTNYKGYDLQLITGLYKDHFTTGIGWAGSIDDVGFKGEAQYYANKKDSFAHLNITAEADYIFKNGWYLSGSLLYNRQGLHQPVKDWALMSFQIAPTNLMPSRWNILLNGSKEFTPRFNGSMSTVYSPEVKMLILFPSFKYNLETNIDLDLVWQSFFSELDAKFQAISHRGFLRIKWSF